MTTTATATIETLTAEVRTLVVGSRQVTLSIAKQLDIVDLSRLRVFGRVHISKDPNYVIGADTDGTLALSKYTNGYMYFDRPLIGPCDHDGGHIIVCATGRQQNGQVYRLTLDGVEFEILTDATQPCGIEGHTSRYRGNDPDECDGWQTNGHRDQISQSLQSQLAEQADKKALHKAAAESPLIVLAGLK